MRMLITRTQYVLAVCIILSIASAHAQTTISRDVVGSGGRAMQSGGHRLHGTISQTTIGRLKRYDDRRHNVGFWYKAWQGKAASIVMIPVVEAAPGEKVTIPLILVQSRRLFSAGARKFTARIRFNSSLLEPLGSPLQYQIDKGDGILSVSGEAHDTSGVLLGMEFLAKLGNSEMTPMVIEDFRWESERQVSVTKQDGEFRLLGVCREGGQIRLILSGESASIISAYPNPASAKATVEFQTSEIGPTRLYMLDLLGREVAEWFRQDVVPSRYSVDIDLHALASGSYLLVLQTPTERITRAFEVRQ